MRKKRKAYFASVALALCSTENIFQIDAHYLYIRQKKTALSNCKRCSWLVSVTRVFTSFALHYYIRH